MEVWNGVVGADGADHGQGALRSHMKVYTRSPEYCHIYNSQAKEKIHRADKCGYSILNNTHMDCKNDHPSVLEYTVAKDIDFGYESLMVSQMVFVGEKVQVCSNDFCYQKMRRRVLLRENWKSVGLSGRM
jgi:hypothetical protein